MSYEEEKQDRKIEQLEAEIERLRAEMENYGDDYVCQMKSKDSRIKELEDALAEERAKCKIGPDAALKKQWDDVLGTKPPRSWQITDERVRAICWAEEMAGDCKAGDVLRDMLEEAGRE